MNLQSILKPLVDGMQWTFKHLLEPISPYFNWICIVFLFFALGYWVVRQKKYNEKATREGTIH